jgi:hypothetical protein
VIFYSYVKLPEGIGFLIKYPEEVYNH